MDAVIAENRLQLELLQGWQLYYSRDKSKSRTHTSHNTLGLLLHKFTWAPTLIVASFP